MLQHQGKSCRLSGGKWVELWFHIRTMSFSTFNIGKISADIFYKMILGNESIHKKQKPILYKENTKIGNILTVGTW